jgi:MFS transporter, PAT family, beta-lactamase induction signal transducer AmpG
MMTFKRNTANPFTFLFLVLPYGLSGGFVSVTLPFLLTQHGFSVAAAASITALGLSANILRFLWAPMTDLSLSLHKWYLIGIGLCTSTLLLLCFIPLNINSMGVLTITVFLSQIAATLIVSPVGGFMAKTVPEVKKGRAGGWFQAGNLGGTGIGGGAGIWLSSHFSYQAAIIILSIAILICSVALHFVPQVYAEKDRLLKERFKMITVDIRNLFRSPIAFFTMAVIIMPIGIGAASFLWSSVATDWKVNADTVALITGTLSGVICVIGCVAGGWIADKLGRWWLYFGSGTLMALVTLVMSFSAYIPTTYIIGVLLYAFTCGTSSAAFSAVILHAIGKGLASTKYALLSSIGNIPIAYMTYFDGRLHDAYSIKIMLLGETFLGICFVIISLFVLYQLRLKKIV